MNDKFGRDGRYRDDRFRGEEFRREREAREPFWRGSEDDRAFRSPDQEFETSGNYREPREDSYGSGSYGRNSNGSGSYGGNSYGSGSYGSGGYGGTIGNSRYDASRGSLPNRSRFDGSYAPSYGSGWTSEVRGGFSGRGPKGYARTDERIREDVCDRLSWNDEVDATDISVRVENGEVTLEGSVETRHMKRIAADLAEDVNGVQDVHNTIRVKKPMLTEIKEKLSGEERQHHYANTGTKTANGSV